MTLAFQLVIFALIATSLILFMSQEGGLLPLDP